MTEWIRQMREKGYTISVHSDLKEFANESLQALLIRDREFPAPDLSAED